MRYWKNKVKKVYQAGSEAVKQIIGHISPCIFIRGGGSMVRYRAHKGKIN